STTSSSEIGSLRLFSRFRSSSSRGSGVSARSFAHSARVKTRCGAMIAGTAWSIRLLLPPGFFGKPALPRALLQFRHHRGKRSPARAEEHQQVVEHVGGLAGERRIILAEGGNDRLDCFLAELAGAALHPAGDEAGGVGS